MKFENLTVEQYREVIEFIAARATRMQVYDIDTFSITRDGLNIHQSFLSIDGIQVEDDYALIEINKVPFCVVRVAIKTNNTFEKYDLYKKIMVVK